MVTTTVNNERSQTISVRWFALFVVVACLSMPGCQAAVYKSASLPARYRVPPVKNVNTINLTRLSSSREGDSQIAAGDVLELTVVSGYEMGRPTTLLLRVSETGDVNVPLVGLVPVAGLEPVGAEQNIASFAVQRGVYQRPYVTVMIKEQRLNKVTVIGAVKEQGTHELPRGSSDLLGALAAAGGLSDDAGEIVEILRKPRILSPASGPRLGSNTRDGETLASYTSAPSSAPVSTRVNLAEAVTGKAGDFHLGDGDVVMALPREPRVIHVLGLVRSPGQFDIPPNEDVHVLDALAWAGGRTMQLANEVRVIRRLPSQDKPIVIEVSVREAKANGDANLRLAPGDLVSVEETAATAALETLKSFIRFGVSSTIPIF